LKKETRGKSKIAISKLLLFLFALSAINAVEEVTVTGDGSNKSEVWGRSPQPLEANGDLGANAVAIFPVFLNKAFFCKFWSKFLLKNVFLNNCKVC